MHRRFATLLSCFLLILLSTAASAQPDQLKEIDPALTSVVVGGLWSHEGKAGFYRLLLFGPATKGGGNRMFIQWIGVNPDEVVASVPVLEFSEKGRWQVGTPRIKRPLEDGLRADMYARNLDSVKHKQVTIRLEAGAPGHYTCDLGK